jgi:hypothetical protein
MAEHGTPWDDKEINLLKELAGKHPANYISEQVGRSLEGVRKQIRKLGLKAFVPGRSERPAEGKTSHKGKEGRGAAPVRIKTYVESRPGLRQKEARTSVSYPPLDYCMNCKAPVSDWDAHVIRMGRFGCARPAA